MAVVLVACSSGTTSTRDGSVTGGGGVATSGGAVVSGGSPSTGGGLSAGGAVAGGASATARSGGNTQASGGSAISGGRAATGGSLSGGGSSAQGGLAATGGSNAIGGIAAAGGIATGGGTIATGGAAGGGTTKGGTTATGGITATGGAKSAGGASDAGAGTGGSNATGGTAALGDGGVATTTSNFHCVNWADTGDNFQNGVLQPSGLSAASDTYATVKAKADAVLSGFQTLLGANTVRIPINEPTVVTNAAWWTAYKGIIDSAIGKNMKVIIGYWAIKGGNLDNPSAFYTMWQTVIYAYLASDLVYFEIMNEPYALQPAAFIDFAVQWLAKYPTVPKNRVIVAGNYTDTDVNQQGADPRLAGCLLSLHVYNFSSTTTTEQGWGDYLKKVVGPYYNRTIATEYGVVMTTGITYTTPTGGVTGTSTASSADKVRIFTPVADPTINITYMNGITNQLRAWGMGSCLWVGLRNNDTTSITQLSGTGTNLSLTVTNASALTRIRWGWGL